MKYIVDIKGEIEGDYEIIGKYKERPKGQLINGGRYCSYCARLFNELEQKYYNYCPECGTKIIKED